MPDARQNFRLAANRSRFVRYIPALAGLVGGTVDAPGGLGRVFVRLTEGESSAISTATNPRGYTLAAGDKIWLDIREDGDLMVVGQRYDGTPPVVPGLVAALDDLSDVDTSTTAPVALDGLLFDGSNWVPGVTGIAPAPGRLSLSSTERYPTSDIAAATTLWYLRTGGRYIHLYENDTTGAMIRYELPFQTSISLSGKTADTNYDVFIYDNSGTLTLELVAWTNDTTRATSLTYRYGVRVKSGELNKLYLGTIRTTGTTGQCEDSEAKRFVWNEYQTKRRNLHADAVSAHTYASTTIRQWNASSAAQVEWVNGDRSVFVSQGEFSGYSSVSSNRMEVGLGLDTTTAHSRFVSTRETVGYVRFHIGLISAVDEGYHYLAATQSTDSSTATYGSYDIDVELEM